MTVRKLKDSIRSWRWPQFHRAKVGGQGERGPLDRTTTPKSAQWRVAAHEERVLTDGTRLGNSFPATFREVQGPLWRHGAAPWWTQQGVRSSHMQLFSTSLLVAVSFRTWRMREELKDKQETTFQHPSSSRIWISIWFTTWPQGPK